MKKRLKITEGKADVVSYSDGSELVGFVNIENGKSVISITNIFDNKYFDAELIADAFNTANETDKLPSEIKQERDSLLAKLRFHADIFAQFRKRYELTDNHRGELHSAELNTVELINKIENNE